MGRATAHCSKSAPSITATVKTSEPGTLTYILHKNTKDPTEFTYYEVYQDQAGAADVVTV